MPHLGRVKDILPSSYVPDDWGFKHKDSEHIVYESDSLPLDVSVYIGKKRSPALSFGTVNLYENSRDLFLLTLKTDDWREQIYFALVIMKIFSYEDSLGGKLYMDSRSNE